MTTPRAAVKTVIITTGDIDGIGTEVAAKALKKIGPQKKFRFVLLRSSKTPKSHLKIIDSRFTRKTFLDLDSALACTRTKIRELCDVVIDSDPQNWVYAAAKACKEGHAHAIATAPMNKKIFQGRPQGHTEILKEVSGADPVFMTFLGREFNVLTVTGHVSVTSVGQHLTGSRIVQATVLASDFKRQISTLAKKPIAVVGLNPHSGENGLIGNEEISVIKPAVKSLQERGFAVEGPLVPDVAFIKSNWKKYSFYICLYHDQALIPFKMVHGQDSGVHLTLGLPFVRTSVDHGTAKDIFNKNRANPGSMIDAIKWAMRLA